MRTTFARLAVGQHFRFASEWDFPHSGMRRGEAVKISHYQYRYVDDPRTTCRVGSARVEVVPEPNPSEGASA